MPWFGKLDQVREFERGDQGSERDPMVRERGSESVVLAVKKLHEVIFLSSRWPRLNCREERNFFVFLPLLFAVTLRHLYSRPHAQPSFGLGILGLFTLGSPAFFCRTRLATYPEVWRVSEFHVLKLFRSTGEMTLPLPLSPLYSNTFLRFFLLPDTIITAVILPLGVYDAN